MVFWLTSMRLRRVNMSSYRSPSAAEVEATLLKIPTYQLRRVFYEGLQNPLWVRPLLKAGAFARPPEPETTDDGYIRDVYWPEISYLVRVASEAPADVVEVLLTLKDSNNAWVKRAVFEIGCKVPASEGVRLQPLLQSWTQTGFGWRTDPRDLVSFAVHLLEGGETKAGRWLANHLFTPRPSQSDGLFGREPELALGEYWYQEELPRLIPALGTDALKAVTGWLVSYEKFAGHAGGEHDFSGMIRPSIRSRRDVHGSPEDALVDGVRDLALDGMLGDPDATALVLLRPGVQLLRKIAMFVVAEAIRQRVSAGEDAMYLLSVAERLLGDRAADDENLRVEYAELAQGVATVDTNVLDVINGFLAYAYDEDLRWIRARLIQEGSPEEEITAQITERADHYKHQWLSAIGPDALPPQLRNELAELDGRYGEFEGALAPNGLITSWSGPNPYSSQDEMAVMSPTELVAHLASWHDTGNGWGPEPSHEGQGRELARLLTTNPLALSGQHDLVRQLRPTYLRAILQGWEAALKADLELDWAQAANLIGDVLTHSDTSDLPVEGRDMDDDKDFRWAKGAAVGLLEELVKKREAISFPEEMLNRYAELLIHAAADEQAWVEYDAYEPGENSMDPLTISLNWQWPKRLRALIYLAVRSIDAPWKQDAMAAIERELDRNDRHGAGSAVLGETIARLFVDSPDWLKSRIPQMFGSEASISRQQQIALTTAMATHYYHVDLYDILSGPMRAAISLGDDLISGWRSNSTPEQRIGEWVINALIYGHKSSDDPVVQAFFDSAKPRVRGEALGRIAWSFFHAERVDDSIRDRLADLWEERVQHVREHPEDHEELSGFFWFAKSSKFPAKWWLPRLREALELEPALATERYMIGSDLALASSVDPATALSVLRSLLESRDEGGMVSYDLTRYAVPIVIANAIAAGDADLKAKAEAYMNELGAKGNLGLEAEVNAVLEGKVTGADLDD